MKKISISFRPDGTASIEAFGFMGRECERATRDFEAAIGRVVSRKLKPAAQIEEKQTLKAGRR